MGAFVLGVLVGWLAEWLFYTFWVKAGDDGDCSAIKAELELKNRQISSLQAQLASVSDDSKGKGSSASKAATKSSAQKSAKQSAVSSNSKSASTPTVSASKATGKASGKGSAKAKPAKSTAVKKPTAKKAAVSKKATSKSSTKPKTKAGGDDFTKLSGIGPSMSATLKSLGIDTFQKLAATDDDILRDMLEQSGARMNNNKEAMDSWNEQATLAGKGDFVALKKMQEELNK